VPTKEETVRRSWGRYNWNPGARKGKGGSGVAHFDTEPVMEKKLELLSCREYGCDNRNTHAAGNGRGQNGSFKTCCNGGIIQRWGDPRIR